MNCQGRAAAALPAARVDKLALFTRAGVFSLFRPGGPRPSFRSRVVTGLRRLPTHPRRPAVFSLLGVLAITLVLLVAVVLTAGLVLGK